TDLGHTGQHRQPVHQVAHREVGELGCAQLIAAQRHPHHRTGVPTGSPDFARIGLGGKVCEHSGNRIAHVTGGIVDLAFRVKLHADPGFADLAGGFDGAYSVYAADGAFDDLDDLGVRHLGSGACVVHVDRDDGGIDVR